MPKLSVTIITKDEEADIAGAIASVAWADEILVVDSHSTDRTVEVARKSEARVIVIVRDWPGYIEQKNYAASQASHDWILSIDADERVTPELARELQQTMRDPAHSAYEVPRLTWHLGRWIRGTDWYPDYQTRLYDRRVARWTGKYVHESVAVAGPRGRLKGDLQHFAYRGIEDHSRRSTAIRHWPRARCTRMAGAPRSRRCFSTGHWRSCATTWRRAGSASARQAQSCRP